MDEERQAWHKQFGSNFGAREYVRFAVVFIIWMFLGGALSIILGSSVVIIMFLFAAFTWAAVSSRWKPAYSLLRIILGNKNLPTEPMPPGTLKSPTQKRPWWSYLPTIWWLLLDLLLLYFVIRYFAK